jgi:hypothetical protein
VGGEQIGVERAIAYSLHQAKSQCKCDSGVYSLQAMSKGRENGAGLGFALELAKQERDVGRRTGDVDRPDTFPSAVIVGPKEGEGQR